MKIKDLVNLDNACRKLAKEMDLAIDIASETSRKISIDVERARDIRRIAEWTQKIISKFTDREIEL